MLDSQVTSKFQFLIGSLGATPDMNEPINAKMFQFLIGSLGAIKGNLKEVFEIGFNSS